MSALSFGVAPGRQGECQRGADGVVGGGLGEAIAFNQRQCKSSLILVTLVIYT